MIRNYYEAYAFSRLRQRQLIDEAQHQQLVRHLTASRFPRLYAPLLVWFGSRLILWGWRLKRRYRSLPNAPIVIPHF